MSRESRNYVGRKKTLVSRHSMQSYILTYYGLRKREPLITLRSHKGEKVGWGGVGWGT